MRGLLVVAAMVVVTTACNGSDDTDAAEAEESVVSDASGDDAPATTDAADSGEADAEEGAEFCDQVRVLDAMESSDDDLGATLEQFDALIDDAPDEVRGELEVVFGAFSEIAELDEDDPDSFAAFIEVFNRPEVIEASENLETYGVEVCGLDPADDEDTSSDSDAGDSGEIEAVGTGDDEDDLDDPYDEEFWGPIDPEEMSIPGIKQHLDLEYSDTGWFDTLISYGISQEVDVGVDGPIDEADAVPLCEAVLEYAGPIEPDVTITVGDGTDTLATGNVADGCSASS